MPLPASFPEKCRPAGGVPTHPYPQETISAELYIHYIQLTGKSQKTLRFIFSSLPYNHFAPYAPSKSLYDKYMANKTRLPQDEVSFLDSLSRPDMESRLKALWEVGWSLAMLGDSLKPSRPKTTIHFWVKRAENQKQFRTLPSPPPKSLTSEAPTKKAPRVRSVSPNVPPDMKPRLKELARLAKRYRARTTADSPFAEANRDLTAMATTLRSMGVPTAKIAAAAGVSYRAMARRLSK